MTTTLGPTPVATTTAAGGVLLSSTPADATAPVAVETADSRMTNARAPSGSAGGDLGGTYPNPTVAKAQSGFTVGGTAAVLTDDARLSDPRTPTDASVTAAKVAASLKPSGTAAAGTEALRALGTSASTAAAGDDSRLSDQRTPSDASVTAAKVAASLKPSGSAATTDEALRALGTSASTAAAGNDSRLSDSRAPNGSAGGDLGGSYPNPTVVTLNGKAVSAVLFTDSSLDASKLTGSVASARLPAATTGAAGAALLSSTPANAAAPVVVEDADVRVADGYGFFRSSDCSTMPRQLMVNVALTSGQVYSMRARNRKAQTYTKIRGVTGSSGSSVTQFRMGVWNSSGTLLAQTADLSASFAANTLYDNVALINTSGAATSVTLALYDEVFLGMVLVGTSVSFGGAQSRGAVVMDAVGSGPRLTRGASGYSSGNLPSVTSAQSLLPWVELIP